MMASAEVDELRKLIEALSDKVRGLADKVEKLDEKMVAQGSRMELMLSSLGKCQARCHVDNPPGRWRGLGRAILGLFEARHQLTSEE
jgi:hypothetical protein